MPKDPEAIRRALVGRWKKVTTAVTAAPYPDDLELFENGIYRGRRGPVDEPEFTIWDAGAYEILTPDQIRISTANDAEIVYSFSLSEKTLRFFDQDGSEFRYKRAV